MNAQKWFTLIITTALPLAFVVQHLWSEASFARRGVALGGQPPIDRLLFTASKYLAIGIWFAVSLQSWGIGWQAFPGVRVLRSLSGGLWVFGFGLLFLGRINLGGHLRMGLPNEATRFHRNGAYRFTRNPMYTGIDATMIAAILYTGNPAILAAGVFVIALHHWIILVEERWLLATFGEAYERYRERVGRYMTVPLAARSRMRALWTLLGMGHCAPTIMSSFLHVCGRRKADWLVRLASALPGGIGNTGHECGAVTSPLVVLGTQHGLREVDRGLPVIFDKGQAVCGSFVAGHQTIQCKEIRGNDGFPRHCIMPVLRSAELWRDALDGNHENAIPAGTRESYSRLYSHLAENEFHCAQAVLGELGYSAADDRELFDATSAFMGGTLFMGKTCSAFTAGVMAIGLRTGEIEDSPLRVIRLLAIMTVGGNAFDEKINKFNRSMNRGYKLSGWFTKEFGSTQCQAITHCDFSDPTGVNNYIEGDCIMRCKQITEKVAVKVQTMIST
jgi:protein-S-isoprenylcysteine O-methyltransferase Ste14